MKSVLATAALALLLAASAGLAQETKPADEQIVIDRLSKLDGNKLTQLFSHVGIEPSGDFLNCLCRGEHGFHYFPDGPSGTTCRRIGSLGGVMFEGFDSARSGSCSTAYPLADGRTVIEAIADAARPPVASCPAVIATVGSLRAAAPFAYDPWPELFDDVSPDRLIHELSETERAALRAIAGKFIAVSDRIVELTLEGAYTIADFLKVAPLAGYKVITSPNVDLRLDLELAEFAFKVNPKTGRLQASEYLLKYPVFGKGRNLEVAIGLTETTWDGRLKLGFSSETNVPIIGQLEGKFGFEYDTGAVLTTSLDDEPPAVSPSRLDRLWSGLESYLAGVDFYFGAATGPGPQIGEHSISLGPESTFSIKQAYSDAVFDDMLTALDAVLVQQQAVEEKRHQMIRDMAARLGVANAECGTIGDVTRGVQTKIIAEAKARGIATEGRPFKDIRRELETPVAGGNVR